MLSRTLLMSLAESPSLILVPFNLEYGSNYRKLKMNSMRVFPISSLSFANDFILFFKLAMILQFERMYSSKVRNDLKMICLPMLKKVVKFADFERK